MTITIDQWRAAADHVKRIEELDDLLGGMRHNIEVRINRSDIDEVLSNEACGRIYAFVEQEVMKVYNQAAEELLERYGVKV